MNSFVKIIQKNKTFLMVIVLVGLLAFLTHKILTSKAAIKESDFYIKSSVELKSEDLSEEKKIVVDAKQKKKLNLLIKNNYNSRKKVYVWYKVEDDRKVKVGNLFVSKTKLSKEGLIVNDMESLEITIGIKNDLERSTSVEFGIIYTDVDALVDNANNYTFIDDVFRINNQKVLSVGDKITLKDNSSWHVIENSDSSNIYMVLLKDDVIKINEDSINIDVKNDLVLHETSDENISFYLDNNYRKILEEKDIQIGEEGEIRLITLSELQSIGEYEYKEYNYYAKKTPKWLVIKNPWWTMTPFSNDSHYYVNGKNILSIKDDKKVRAAIRPVVKLLKSNIK